MPASCVAIAKIQPAPSSAVSWRAFGPNAERWIGILSLMLMTPMSGDRNRVFRRLPSSIVSTISPASSAWITRMYSRMSSSLTAESPIVRRAVKPVEIPISMRPGASALIDASALAATGAMRPSGTSTQVPSLIFAVCIAAAAMPTNTSQLSIGASMNQAFAKPSSSARFTTFHESAAVATLMPKSIAIPR